MDVHNRYRWRAYSPQRHPPFGRTTRLASTVEASASATAQPNSAQIRSAPALLTLMAVNHHGIRVTGGRGSLMTRNVARLPPPSCGLSRLVTNLDPVDQKEVNRALLPCGHGRCGNSHGGRS
jgi:hypothetical protein